jgi:RNA polymerase sigma-70 factor, ECF subfamily
VVNALSISGSLEHGGEKGEFCLREVVSYDRTIMSGSVDETGVAGAFGIEHVDGLFGYALVLTRDRTEAEDLVQETYVRALDAMGRLRENSNIKGWLFTILKNLWFNELRKRRNSPQIVEIDGEQDAADGLAGNLRNSHEIFVTNEDAERVQKAINKLPVEFREIILLREYEELSYQEIANVLVCPVGTVMSRLGRARAKLRSILTDTESSPRRFGEGVRHGNLR